MKLNRAIGVIDSGVGGFNSGEGINSSVAERAHYIFRGYSTFALMVHVLEKKCVNLRGK